MGMCAALVWALTLVVNAVAAQETGTEAGIRAMLRGDYLGAARILRPLANDAAHPDPVAQFFLALVYDSNQVPGDGIHACSLFARAARQSGPFAGQAAGLAAAIREELGAGAEMCVADEGWQGGPPQSLVLAPGHQVEFTDHSVLVTFGDREQRTDILLPPQLALKIVYTPLDVTRPLAARRDFVQWIGWLPENPSNPSSWTQIWVLSEVVGDRWIQIASETNKGLVKGPTRPVSSDVSRWVRLRVNAGGEAEYEIAAGSAWRTVAVPWQGQR
jgi:hypothetical protein